MFFTSPYLLLVTAEYCKAEGKQLSRAEIASVFTAYFKLDRVLEALANLSLREKGENKESGTEHIMIVKQCKQKNRSIFTSQFTAHVSEVPDLTLPLFPALLLLYQFSLITEKLWANLDKSALELTRNLAPE